MTTQSTQTKAAEKLSDTPALTKLVLDRPTFKGEAFAQRIEGTQDEKYTGPAIEGWLVGLGSFEMTDEQTGELRLINSYVIELTKPCKGFDRGAKAARDVKIGEQLRVVETAILKQAFTLKGINVANHPSQELYVHIMPTMRIPLPNNAERKLWKYDIATGKPRQRSLANMDHVAQMMTSISAPAQLVS